MSPFNRHEHEIQEDSEHSVMSIAKEMNETLSELDSVNDDKSPQLRFGSVAVREFDLVVGDSPEVRVGPPISLGWKFNDKEAVPIDVYERSHISKKATRLSSITRKNLLVNVYGIAEEEVRLAEKEVQKIREQRINTFRQSKSSEKAEAVLQSAKRKLRRRFSKEKLLNMMAHSHSYMTMIPLHA